MSAAVTTGSAADDDVLLLTITEACARLRISRWSFYQLVNTGRLPTVKIGSRRLVASMALVRFVEQLQTNGGATS